MAWLGRKSGPRKDLRKSDLQEIIELPGLDWTLIDLQGNWKLNFIVARGADVTAIGRSKVIGHGSTRGTRIMAS